MDMRGDVKDIEGAARAQYSSGLAHAERLDLDGAAACFFRAIALEPGFAAAHMELAETLLRRGELLAGWREYEWRYRLAHAVDLLPRFSQPLWNGMRMPEGRILLIGDQGFGDTIQFARYIPQVARRCGEVLLGCSPELRSLLATVPGAGRSFVRWEDIPPFDAWCPLSSLPGIFGTDIATIPGEVPYLAAGPETAERWRERLAAALPAGRLKVGLVGSGRSTNPRLARRAIGPEALAPILGLGDVALVWLQKERTAGNGAAGLDPAVLDISTELTDFSETAAAIAALDLVISTDTSVPHLAGALGKPVWLLLSRTADWRWFLDREDSPWYPTMRLFRQGETGGWSDVVARVVAELSAVAGRARERLLPGRGAA